MNIKTGKIVIIPTRTHKPIVTGEAEVLMFESKTTLNKGNTKKNLQLKSLMKFKAITTLIS